jgi:hypothetical protein
MTAPKISWVGGESQVVGDPPAGSGCANEETRPAGAQSAGLGCQFEIGQSNGTIHPRPGIFGRSVGDNQMGGIAEDEVHALVPGIDDAFQIAHLGGSQDVGNHAGKPPHVFRLLHHQPADLLLVAGGGRPSGRVDHMRQYLASNRTGFELPDRAPHLEKLFQRFLAATTRSRMAAEGSAGVVERRSS